MNDNRPMTMPPPTTLVRRATALTDVGRRRKGNEDAYFLDNELGLYVVADGMGGHAAGEVASAAAVETVFGMVKRGLRDLPELHDPIADKDAKAFTRLMESAVQGATYMVYSMAEQDKEKSGMGTTITALLISGEYAVTAQVGDSRIYRVKNHKSEQLTEDHTLIAWQIKQGIISEAEALTSPHKNVITRAVGNRDYVEVDTSIVGLQQGDRFLLCSDGLHGYLEDGDITPIVSLGGESAVNEFIKLANDRGGKDNITAILVEID